MKQRLGAFLITVAALGLMTGCWPAANTANNASSAAGPAPNKTNAPPANSAAPSVPKSPGADRQPATGPAGAKRIGFDIGKSSATFSDAVIRGERATYLLEAKSGQTMDMKITSLEDNAVFQVVGPDGKFLKKAGETDDAKSWIGPLPATGDYKIIVGGTRGNASFTLTVAIK